jgi:hypothetical protein
MPISYPSKVLTILDVPEVWRFKTSFKYNFFVTDEKTDISGDARIQGATTEGAKSSLRKRIPRWIEFKFDPADVRSNSSVDNEFVTKLSDPKKVEKLILDNLDKIQKEVDVASKGYSTLNLQDRSIGYKASQLVRLSTRIRGRSLGYKSPYWKKKKGWQYTRSNVAKLLNEVTGDYIAGKWIIRMMGSLRHRSVFYYRTRSGSRKYYRPKWIRKFRSIKQYAQINDKFLHDILVKSVADPTSPFMNELSQKVKEADQIQETARKEGNPGVISDYEYAPNVIPISIDRVNPGEFTSAVKIIGYIIDKWEMQPNRKLKKCDPVIVAGSNAKTAVDTKIKYGSYYVYSIRAVALAQFQAVDEETAQVYAISGLLSSRSSRKRRVRCREYRPPQPPADIDFVWDYAEKKLMIMWSFPVVPQRDVKRFQVFKRPNIYEPFELQIEYDFDDSEVPDPRSEQPRRSKVIEMEEPLTTYWDEEFTKQSVAIYSLCSIDAHDFSSNYSSQYAVWFDETKNKLMKKLISPSGAPKPYPNFYLVEGSDPINGDINLTSDCMKDSGHTSCKIFFDPEYLSIKGENDEELDLWATLQEGGSYKLQVINIDRQKSQVVDIEIDDLRTR